MGSNFNGTSKWIVSGLRAPNFILLISINLSIAMKHKWLLSLFTPFTIYRPHTHQLFYIIRVKSFKQTHRWFPLSEAVALRAHMNMNEQPFFLSSIQQRKEHLKTNTWWQQKLKTILIFGLYWVNLELGVLTRNKNQMQ